MRLEISGDIRGAEFRNVDLSGALFQNVDLSRAQLREAMLVNARISGMIDGLRVNDIEVAPLIDAELSRRYPERLKLRPDDVDGVREAWRVVGELWSDTMRRAAALPEAELHQRVDGEWSLLETVRHLVFVTDLWVGRNVLGLTDHFHPYGVVPTFITGPEEFGIDPEADPHLAEVEAMRKERMRVVTDLIDGLDESDLDRPCGEHTLKSCLWILFDEEWHHNWYANRDLDALVS